MDAAFHDTRTAPWTALRRLSVMSGPGAMPGPDTAPWS